MVVCPPEGWGQGGAQHRTDKVVSGFKGESIFRVAWGARLPGHGPWFCHLLVPGPRANTSATLNLSVTLCEVWLVSGLHWDCWGGSVS